MRKKLFLGIIFLSFFSAGSAQAVCPICTIAVFAGVGLSRWLGINDSITGLWIGGLTISFIIWTINWFNKKNIRFVGRKLLVIAGYYFLIIWPLYHYDIIGHPLNKLWGYDKLIIGITVGSVTFFSAVIIHNYLKRKNGGKAYFLFQKVALPVGILLLFSGVFYLVTKF